VDTGGSVNDDSTRRLPTLGEEPWPPERRPGRGWRRAIIAVCVLLALGAALFGLDRFAASYTEYRIAGQLQSKDGFTQRPGVTIEGFPFLSQVAVKHLDRVHITCKGVQAGSVTASVNVDATSIVLNSSYNGGTIGHVSGTALIGFRDIAKVARSQGAPGLTIRPAGRHSVKLGINFEGVPATATARVLEDGPGKFRLRIVSADGIPVSLLGSVRDLTITIPPLPLGLSIRQVHVTSQGAVVNVTGQHIPFGG
jgi:DUF2993 family protein